MGILLYGELESATDLAGVVYGELVSRTELAGEVSVA
jgi:hypothetical protein